jgi:putative oxidoreductase
MPSLMNAGLLILRVLLGFIFVAHGSQKLFGWLGGHGLSGQTAAMEEMGIRPARLFALLSTAGEFFGGLGTVFGFLTLFASAGIFGSMTVAVIRVHWRNGFWNRKGGVEFPLTLGTLAFVLGLVGPGRYSLDALLRLHLPEPMTGMIVLAATLAVALYAATRPAPPKPE